MISRWYRNVVFNLRRAWYAVSCCLRSPRQGRGILELHDEVQSCEYEDVQVMWHMLTKPEMETEPETETVANQAEEPSTSEAVVVKKAGELLETTEEKLEKALDW